VESSEVHAIRLCEIVAKSTASSLLPVGCNGRGALACAMQELGRRGQMKPGPPNYRRFLKPMITPVKFLGIQQGFGGLPAMELYTLLEPLGDHPAGSTVSRRTLEQHGATAVRVDWRQAAAKSSVAKRPSPWPQESARGPSN
jgi:hypothetical protein